jgi:hypothetical protein
MEKHPKKIVFFIGKTKHETEKKELTPREILVDFARVSADSKFKIMVASACSKGDEIYLDPDILQIVDKNNFEKVSDKITASLSETKIDTLEELLQEKFSDSVSLSLAIGVNQKRADETLTKSEAADGCAT